MCKIRYNLLRHILYIEDYYSRNAFNINTEQSQVYNMTLFGLTSFIPCMPHSSHNQVEQDSAVDRLWYELERTAEYKHWLKCMIALHTGGALLKKIWKLEAAFCTINSLKLSANSSTSCSRASNEPEGVIPLAFLKAISC